MKKLLYFFVPLIFFATPFESVAIIPGVSVVKLVTVLFLLIALLYYKSIPLPRNRFLLLFFIYTVFTILSTAWSIDKTNTLQYSLGTILPSFVVVLYLYHSIRDKSDIDRVFNAYAWGSTIVSLIALYMFATGFRFANTTDEARLTVLGQDQNELSFLLSWGIVSVIYLLRYTQINNSKKIIHIVQMLLLAFTILSTGSRTGFVILLAIVFIFLTLYTKKGRIIYITPLLVAAIFLLFNYLPESISSRLFETTEQIQAGDLTGRGLIWQLGFSAFQSEGAWIQGTGFKLFRTLMDIHYGWPKAPHNTYFVTLIELGIIGLSLYFLMIWELIKKAFFLYRKESIYFSLLIIPILLAMMTLGTETRRWLFLLGIYISPQKNRAVKNKSYFYNCYGKEEEFHIKNQG